MFNRALAGTAALTLASATLAVAPARANYAYPDAFVCQRNASGVFTTYAVKGDVEVPVIQWTSSFGSAAGLTQEDRCNIVSNRFQSAVENRSLQYLTHGYVNNYPVICAASYQGGSCNSNNMIFTLPYNSGYLAASTLRSLGDIGRLASGPLQQSAPGSCSTGPVAANAIVSDGNFSPVPDTAANQGQDTTALEAGCVVEDRNGQVYVDFPGFFGNAAN